MGFSLSKIFKPKSTINAAELLNQVDYNEGTKFAENETNKIYIDFEELGGFPYLKTVIFGVSDIRIKRVGCTITFILKDDKITLQSDNTDIESNQIHKSGVFHTPIDFELDESEMAKIKNEIITEIQYDFKGKILTFNPH